MRIIERLAQWISDILYGNTYAEDEKRAQRYEEWKRAIEDARHTQETVTETDLECIEEKLSKEPKTSKAKTKKKTEGKAATKAKPARDASGRFTKQK